MRPLLTLAAAAFAVAPSAAVTAQEHAHDQVYPASPPEQLGRVSFPAGCRPAVQPRVERAVALLHSFWYEEAEKAFTEVTAADSTCAFGYWGQAMSVLHPLWAPPTSADAARGLAAAERAVRMSRAGTRQRDYAEAIAAFWRGYDGPAAFRPRLTAYEAAMANVARRHPRDHEAKTFYALVLIGVGQLDAGDTTYARQRQAGAILEPLLARNPDHPGLAHYVIHAYDSPALAQRGVPAAERYAAIAPSVPHAQHMPSHIYTRVGNWKAAVESNRRSAAAGQEFEQRLGMSGLWDQHAHAWDYLMYAYLQLGMEREAKALKDSAAAVTSNFPGNAITSDYALAAIPARYALERGDWADAAKLPVRPAPAWRATEGITRFARAIGAARSGAPDQARAEVDSLADLERTLTAAGGAQTYWATQVRIQRLAAGAWVTIVQGDTTGALKQSLEAAELDDRTEKHPVTPGAVLPARELYADMLLIAGKPGAAARAYRATLERQPGRARSLAGLKRSGMDGNGRERPGADAS
jgi:tetratricopeptide (TPR) repeat protein